MDNEQTKFWKGQFGNDYTARNINLVENNYQMFKRIFYNDDYNFTCEIDSICEFGAGSGQNIQALQRIFPDAIYGAVEINDIAYIELNKIIEGTFKQSILDYDVNCGIYDLVLSKGLLIHIHPDNIEKAFDVLYNASNKYILLCEYYSPVRREILYRGEHNKLWAFDFLRPLIDKGCILESYGFVSKYDKYSQDDITYALFSK
jgi:pseudaminic acid biosynthesis-associated methylase